MPPREKGREGCGGLCGWALELDWLLISLLPWRARGRVAACARHAWMDAPEVRSRPALSCLFGFLLVRVASFLFTFLYRPPGNCVCIWTWTGLDWPEMPEVGSRLAGGEPVWSHAILGAVAVTVCGQLNASRHAWLLPKPISPKLATNTYTKRDFLFSKIRKASLFA